MRRSIFPSAFARLGAGFSSLATSPPASSGLSFWLVLLFFLIALLRRLTIASWDPSEARSLLAILLLEWKNTVMLIGDRLRTPRKQKNLSQGDIEKRSGLLRAYLSRVENGYTIPTILTLDKWAKALDLPMYQFFYEGDKPPEPAILRAWKPADEATWGNSGDDAIFLKTLRRLLPKIDEPNRRIIYQIAGKMARRK